MIKRYIDVSNCFCCRLQDKYDDKILKRRNLLVESRPIMCMKKNSEMDGKIVFSIHKIE